MADDKKAPAVSSAPTVAPATCVPGVTGCTPGKTSVTSSTTTSVEVSATRFPRLRKALYKVFHPFQPAGLLSI